MSGLENRKAKQVKKLVMLDLGMIHFLSMALIKTNLVQWLQLRTSFATKKPTPTPSPEQVEINQV